MLTERTVYDQITILEDGQIQLRRARVILDGGVEIHRAYHRQVLEPGQDVSTLSTDDKGTVDLAKRVQDVCAAVWSPEVVSVFKKKKAESQSSLPSQK
ncbi:MAG: hypothetical protein V2A79_14100 [Planctomycetota bacterium]